MDNFLNVSTLDRMNTIGGWCTLIGLVMFSFTAPIVFFAKKETPAPPLTQEYHFFIWPAIVAQAFFNILWGKVGKGFFGVLTIRSFWVTLGFSVTINLACVSLILRQAPSDTPTFNIELIKILYSSELWFISCNFLGDLLSVHVTRYLLNKIIHSKIKKWKYIVWDCFGIVGGYLLMLLPGLIVYQMSLDYEAPNELLQTGLFGNILIPFFLMIFAFTNFPSLLTFFALFAILSITVPTGIYLFLIIFVNVGRGVYKRYLEEKGGLIRRYSKILKSIGAYLSMIGGALLGFPFLL